MPTGGTCLLVEPGHWWILPTGGTCPLVDLPIGRSCPLGEPAPYMEPVHCGTCPLVESTIGGTFHLWNLSIGGTCPLVDPVRWWNPSWWNLPIGGTCCTWCASSVRQERHFQRRHLNPNTASLFWQTSSAPLRPRSRDVTPRYLRRP